MPDQQRIPTYEEFWPFYVREHAQASNRVLHFFGTSLAMLLLLYALATQSWRLLPLVLVVGYGPAWIGHFFVEHNRPATFKYPLWSLVSDFRMWGLMVTGRMGQEVAHAVAAVRK